MSNENPDDGRPHDALASADLRKFQEWASKISNCDLHFFVDSFRPDDMRQCPEAILRRALDDRRIDRAIVRQDVELGWGNHTPSEWQRRFGKRWQEASFVREGAELVQKPVPWARLRAFLELLLTRDALSFAFETTKELTPERRSAMLAALYRVLLNAEVMDDGSAPDSWSFWEVTPDFLNAGEETVTRENQPAYFDSLGHCYSWMGAGPDHWFLLLTSIYPGRPFLG